MTYLNGDIYHDWNIHRYQFRHLKDRISAGFFIGAKAIYNRPWPREYRLQALPKLLVSSGFIKEPHTRARK